MRLSEGRCVQLQGNLNDGKETWPVAAKMRRNRRNNRLVPLEVCVAALYRGIGPGKIDSHPFKRNELKINTVNMGHDQQ